MWSAYVSPHEIFSYSSYSLQQIEDAEEQLISLRRELEKVNASNERLEEENKMLRHDVNAIKARSLHQQVTGQ